MRSPARPEEHVVPVSLRALLDEIVDYAGLFPPAGLPLEEAIRNYARYRREPEAWLLARFVVPAARLADLDAHADLFAADPPFRFSVLAPRTDSPDSFLSALEGVLEAVDAFRRRHGSHVAVESLEIPLPDAVYASKRAPHVVGEARARVADTEKTFFEAPVDERGPELLPPVLEALSADGGAPAGLKVRTGGLEPEAFPAPAHLAHALASCRDAGVPLKATAGLHHPVRRYDASVGAPMYGFLNVFGAAALAAEHRLDPETIETVLTDEDAGDFRFAPQTFAWKHLEVPAAALRRTRAHLALSFGSCSFDEPRDDLRALGLL